MKNFVTILTFFLLIVPALSFGQTIITVNKNNKNIQTSEVKIIACTNSCTQEIKTESKGQNILDILQKESEETVIYPLVQFARKIRAKVQAMDKKNMVSSGSAGTEGEAGGGPSR